MGKEHLSAPAFALGKVSEFRAVIYGNGFEHLGEAVAIFRFQHIHDRFTGLFGNPNGEIVFRLLFQKGQHHSFFSGSFPNHGIAFPVPFFCTLRGNFRS